MIDTSPWKCEACAHAITDGVVLLFNANPSLAAVGSYPVAPSPDLPPDAHSDAYRVERDPSVSTLDEAASLQIQDAMWETLERPINLGIAAYCNGCVPDTHSSAYTIGATRSAAGWMSWVVHLRFKTWVGSWDLFRLSYYWFQNRGINPGTMLG